MCIGIPMRVLAAPSPATPGGGPRRSERVDTALVGDRMRRRVVARSSSAPRASASTPQRAAEVNARARPAAGARCAGDATRPVDERRLRAALAHGRRPRWPPLAGRPPRDRPPRSDPMSRIHPAPAAAAPGRRTAARSCVEPDTLRRLSSRSCPATACCSSAATRCGFPKALDVAVVLPELQAALPGPLQRRRGAAWTARTPSRAASARSAGRRWCSCATASTSPRWPACTTGRTTSPRSARRWRCRPRACRASASRRRGRREQRAVLPLNSESEPNRERPMNPNARPFPIPVVAPSARAASPRTRRWTTCRCPAAWTPTARRCCPSREELAGHASAPHRCCRRW